MLKIQMTGNLGADAVTRTINGQPFVCFKLADNRTYKDKQTGERKTVTTWVSCMKYGENAGLLPYLRKGTSLYIEGEPFTKVYQTQQGTNEAGLNCRVSVLEFLSAPSGNRQQQAAPAYAPAYNPAPAYQPAQQQRPQYNQPAPSGFSPADLEPHDDDLPF